MKLNSAAVLIKSKSDNGWLLAGFKATSSVNSPSFNRLQADSHCSSQRAPITIRRSLSYNLMVRKKSTYPKLQLVTAQNQRKLAQGLTPSEASSPYAIVDWVRPYLWTVSPKTLKKPDTPD